MQGTDSPKSSREISAVLAGLRLLQQALERGETTTVQEILQDVDPPLSADEIDGLCEEIDLGLNTEASTHRHLVLLDVPTGADEIPPDRWDWPALIGGPYPVRVLACVRTDAGAGPQQASRSPQGR
jgi:hypothetical protein